MSKRAVSCIHSLWSRYTFVSRISSMPRMCIANLAPLGQSAELSYPVQEAVLAYPIGK